MPPLRGRAGTAGTIGMEYARQQLFCLHRIEPRSARGQTRGDDAACRCISGVKSSREAWRRFHQRIERFAVAHQMTEARHSTDFRWVVRNACGLQFSRCSATVAHPDRKNGFGKDSRCRCEYEPWPQLPPRRPTANASAVATFMTSTASFSPSAKSASRAAV